MDGVPPAARVALREHLNAPVAAWETAWAYEPRPAADVPRGDARPAPSEDDEPWWWDPPEVIAARQRARLGAAGPA